jgi:hypothetical protein
MSFENFKPTDAHREEENIKKLEEEKELQDFLERIKDLDLKAGNEWKGFSEKENYFLRLLKKLEEIEDIVNRKGSSRSKIGQFIRMFAGRPISPRTHGKYNYKK